MKTTGRNHINHTSKYGWLKLITWKLKKIKDLQICLESKTKYYTIFIHKAKRLRIFKNKKKKIPTKKGKKENSILILLYGKENSNKSISRDKEGDFEIVKGHR